MVARPLPGAMRKELMGSHGHVFQLYRTGDDVVVWWRLISPNGRGLARAAEALPTAAAALESVRDVCGRLADLTPALRLEAGFRWRWILEHDGVPVVQGLGDHDRRIRCEQARRRFLLVAPVAEVDRVPLAFQGSAGRAAFVPRSPAGTRDDARTGFDHRALAARSWLLTADRLAADRSDAKGGAA